MCTALRTKERLAAAATILGRAAWEIADAGINAYLDQLPAKDLQLVDAVAVRRREVARPA